MELLRQEQTQFNSKSNCISMKIWENFKTKAGFGDIKNKRQCWSTCLECKRKWDNLETTHVHMVVTDKGETRYLCDGCKDEISGAKNNG